MAPGHKLGHPLLHRRIAQIMWREANTELARRHYMLSQDGDGCGQMLVRLSVERGNGSEVDLFAAQMVLQQLYLNERATAARTFATYAKYHPLVARSEPPFAQPLLNFVFFLLQCCETGRLSMFRALCDVYGPALARDATFDKYLQRIGVVYFGAQEAVQRSAGGGLFGDLIGQLFAGLDGDDEEEEEEGDGEGDGGAASGAASSGGRGLAAAALELD